MADHPDLEHIGREILEKCGRVPLAIMTAAGLLKGEYRKSVWSEVNKELWERAQEDEGILPTLRVSYARLPSHLKKCFAYCSLFPKGSIIDKATLIQLWMAQRFIQPSKNKHWEDIGDDYFKELWNRSFFQDETMDAFGNIISCKMHHLMHNLAQKVAGSEYSFLNDDGAVEISERIIHASVGASSEEIPTSFFNARKLRTFLRAGRSSLISIEDFDKFASTFRSLRVLHLGQFACQRSSHGLNSMKEHKHLRYLDLSNNDDINTLPNSFCELQHLQTLKLKYCKNLTELPRDINKLINLRHLENDGCHNLAGMPSGISQLTSIRTLPLFVLGNGGGLSELNGLNNLRGELEIKIKKIENARDDTLESRRGYLEKNYLQTLKLSWDWNASEVYVDGMHLKLFEGLQPNPIYLKGLHIEGYGGFSFPSWMSNMGNSLPELVEITLSSCPKCMRFPLCAQLQYLKVLKLSDLNSLEYIESWVCDFSSSSSTRGWLPSLKEVFLYGLPKLKEWRRANDDGKAKTEEIAEQQFSLNSLEKLTIMDCPELTSMPLHPDIKELNLTGVSSVLINSMTASATTRWTTATTSSPPSLFTLTKLKSLQICDCDGLWPLPHGWLENLSSLERLQIEFCYALEDLTTTVMEETLEHKEIALPKEVDVIATSEATEIVEGKEIALPEEDDVFATLEGTEIASLFHLPEDDDVFATLEGTEIASLFHLPEDDDVFATLEGTEIALPDEDDVFATLEGTEIASLFPLPKEDNVFATLEGTEIALPEEDDVFATSGGTEITLLFPLPEEDDGLQGFRSLRSLKLRHLPKLMSLPEGLQYATELEELSIDSCDALETLFEWMGNITLLKSLAIRNCCHLTSLPRGLQHLTALEKLEISCCPKLKFSDYWPGIPSLRWLQLSNLPKLESFPKVLHHCTALESLEVLDYHRSMTSLDWLGDFKSLRQLTISSYGNLNPLREGIRSLTALQQLTVEECSVTSQNELKKMINHIQFEEKFHHIKYRTYREKNAT